MARLEMKMRLETDNFTLPLKDSDIRKMFKKTVMEESRQVRRWYKYIQSWFSPRKRTKMRTKTGAASGKVDTIYSSVGTDVTHGSVLIWLEDGTKVRYRSMSKNWVSKSKPGGGLNFGSGRGYAAGWNFINPSRIKPRNFRDDIIDKRYPRFVEDANKRFVNMLKVAKWI